MQTKCRGSALGLALGLACITLTAAVAATPSTARIKQVIVRESIAEYPGRCPCPYNIMRNGRACGARSAYSKPGGYAPLCYASDVTDAMVRDYRRRHGDGVTP